MRDTPHLLVLLLIGAMMLAGACGGDDPAIDDSNVTTSSGTQTAASPCQTVRQDLVRLRETLGVPGGIDELKQMLADGLDQLDATVAEGDFGVAREALGQANDDVGRAWDRLTETCGSS